MLLKALESAPARLQSAIALGMAGSKQGGDKLLDAVAKGKASPRLLQDRAVELKLRQAKIANLNQRLAKLTKGLPPADQRIAQLIASRSGAFRTSKASAVNGVKIFEKHCAACHQVGGKGAKIGPQLDGVGIRGPERILEDVLDPNRNVDQAFRATTLVLDNGQLVSGLVLREQGQVDCPGRRAGQGAARAEVGGGRAGRQPAVADAGELRGTDRGDGNIRLAGISFGAAGEGIGRGLPACGLAAPHALPLTRKRGIAPNQTPAVLVFSVAYDQA